MNEVKPSTFLVGAKIIDFFSRSSDIHSDVSGHVETVVCLDKKKPKDYIEIGVDAEDYYKIKDSEEAR